MRECFISYCNNGKETEWIDDGSEEGHTVVTDVDCYYCEGTGVVSDECFCYAREPKECACGAWDDVYDEWYIDEDCEEDNE